MTKFFSNSSIYGVSIFISRAFGLLLLPFYTHHIPPEEYSILAILDVFGLYLGVVIASGIAEAMIKFYYEKKSATWQKLVFSTTLTTAAVFCLAIGSLAFVLAPLIGDLIFRMPDMAYYIRLVTISIALEVGATLIDTSFRVRERPFLSLRLALLRLSVAVPANIYLIAYAKIGILGFLYANILSGTAVMLIIGVPVILKNWYPPNKRVWKEITRFSYPYIPQGLLETLLNNLGVICLTLSGNIATAGIYAVGQKLASLLSFGFLPISFALIPLMHKVSKEKDAAEFYAIIFSWALALLLWGALFLGIFSQEIITLLTPESYDAAGLVILPIAISFVARELRQILRIGLEITKSTLLLPIATFSASCFAVPVAIWLTFAYGPLGAACGAAATYITILLAIASQGQRKFRIPLEYGRILRILGIFMGLAFISLSYDDMNFAFKCIVVLVYPVLILIFGGVNVSGAKNALLQSTT